MCTRKGCLVQHKETGDNLLFSFSKQLARSSFGKELSWNNEVHSCIISLVCTTLLLQFQSLCIGTFSFTLLLHSMEQYSLSNLNLSNNWVAVLFTGMEDGINLTLHRQFGMLVVIMDWNIVCTWLLQLKHYFN